MKEENSFLISYNLDNKKLYFGVNDEETKGLSNEFNLPEKLDSFSATQEENTVDITKGKYMPLIVFGKSKNDTTPAFDTMEEAYTNVEPMKKYFSKCYMIAVKFD